MRECGFSLTRILPYKDKIFNFVRITENTVSENPYSGEYENPYTGEHESVKTHIRAYFTQWMLILAIAFCEFREEGILETFVLQIRVISKTCSLGSVIEYGF